MRSVVAVRLLVCLSLAALSFATFLAGPAPAEPKQLASEEQLKKDWDNDTSRRFYRLYTGELEPTKADEEVLKKAARWYVYRLTLSAHWNKRDHMYNLLKEYDDKMRGLVGASNEAKVVKFRGLFVNELIPCLQEVLSLDLMENQPSVINAGLMLPALGHTGHEPVGDFLANLAKGAKNDVVRLFAFKGLYEYFQAKPATVSGLTENKDRLREIARIDPLIEFVTRKPALPSGAAPPEVDAFRFVRREAIRALGATRAPGIPLLPKLDGELRAAVAHTLLRVLSDGKDSLSPPPSLSEKYEAALGLCRLRATKLQPRYQPEPAVALVGKFLVDFSQSYNADWAHFGGKNVKDPKVPMLPWKACAEQLREGMKEFAANTPAGDTQKQVLELQKNSDGVFTDMRVHKLTDSAVLKAVVKGIRRPDPAVYQKSPSHKIDVGEWPPFGG